MFRERSQTTFAYSLIRKEQNEGSTLILQHSLSKLQPKENDVVSLLQIVVLPWEGKGCHRKKIEYLNYSGNACET
jgi:hypothetical protein